MRKLSRALAGVAMTALLALPATGETLTRPETLGLIETISLTGPDMPVIDEISLPLGKSMVLRFDTAISEATVGDPETADIVPLTNKSLYVLGKAYGSTNLTLFDPDKKVLGIVDIQVTHDTLGLKKRLSEVFPGEHVEVRTNGDKVMLSGKVSSSAVSSRVADIAEGYAPESVYNAVELGASQQVMLSVRFAEVERKTAKELGISTNAFFNETDKFVSSFISPTALDSASFAFLHDMFEVGDVTIDILLDALEQKGVASILAEPTLIAISGESASFLAGGEFPVPVSSTAENGTNRIQVEFKEFGVRLAFTPTVIGDKISLVVTPEVSELDPQNGIRLNDLVIPGLRTRRATTTVELKSGQSFAVAGLMQKNFLDGVDQLPGFSSVPVLGALTRSARYKREETELAIIITAHIVEPVEDGSLVVPSDLLVQPHEFELFFLGKTEARNSPRTATGYRLSTGNSTPVASRNGNTTLGYLVE